MQKPSAISSKEIPHLTVGNDITVIKPIITGGVSCTVKLCDSAQMRKTQHFMVLVFIFFFFSFIKRARSVHK